MILIHWFELLNIWFIGLSYFESMIVYHFQKTKLGWLYNHEVGNVPISHHAALTGTCSVMILRYLLPGRKCETSRVGSLVHGVPFGTLPSSCNKIDMYLYLLYIQSFNGVYILMLYVKPYPKWPLQAQQNFTCRILLQFNRRKQRGLRSVPHFEQHPHSLRCSRSEVVADPCI